MVSHTQHIYLYIIIDLRIFIRLCIHIYIYIFKSLRCAVYMNTERHTLQRDSDHCLWPFGNPLLSLSLFFYFFSLFFFGFLLRHSSLSRPPTTICTMYIYNTCNIIQAAISRYYLYILNTFAGGADAVVSRFVF